MDMVRKTTGGKDRHPKPNNPEDSDEEGAHTYLDYGRCDGRRELRRMMVRKLLS